MTSMLLRVGVLQGTTVVEERLLRAQGKHAFGGVDVFEVQGDRVLFLLEGNRTLDVSERGRVRLADDVTLLFHFVPAPPVVAKPRLPERMRGGFIGELEPIFTAVVIASFTLHAALGVLVKVSEAPRAPEVAELRRIVENMTPPRIDVPRIASAPTAVAPTSNTASTPTVATATTSAGPSQRSSSRGPIARGSGEIDRDAVRAAIQGRGLLVPITGNENGGASRGTASVFGRRDVVSDDIDAALDRTSGVALAESDVGRRREGQRGGVEGEGESNVEAPVDVTILGPAPPPAPIDTGVKRAVKVKTLVDVDEELKTVDGVIDAKAVRDTLKRRSEAFQDCYASAMKGVSKPKAGKMLVEFTIDESGRVSTSSIVRDGVGSAELGQCVEKTLKRIRFEAPKDGEVTISNSFVFQPG